MASFYRESHRRTLNEGATKIKMCKNCYHEVDSKLDKMGEISCMFTLSSILTLFFCALTLFLFHNPRPALLAPSAQSQGWLSILVEQWLWPNSADLASNRRFRVPTHPDVTHPSSVAVHPHPRRRSCHPSHLSSLVHSEACSRKHGHQRQRQLRPSRLQARNGPPQHARQMQCHCHFANGQGQVQNDLHQVLQAKNVGHSSNAKKNEPRGLARHRDI